MTLVGPKLGKILPARPLLAEFSPVCCVSSVVKVFSSVKIRTQSEALVLHSNPSTKYNVPKTRTVL